MAQLTDKELMGALQAHKGEVKKNLTNWEILQMLDAKVYGHTEAKKVLINVIRKSQLRQKQVAAGVAKDDLLEVSNALLISESGTGKTFLVKTLSEIMGFPFFEINATELTHTSAGGGIKSEDVLTIIEKYAKHYKTNAEYPTAEAVVNRSVVFVDEIDKISTHIDSFSNNWNRVTQNSFLKIFENSDRLTSVTWIFAGAFIGIKDAYKKDNKPLGFVPQVIPKELSEITDEDVIKFGLIPELVGRIAKIICLDTLSKEDFKTILLDKLLPRKVKELEYFGYEGFHLTDEEVTEIVDKSFKSGQGVRALKRCLEKLCEAKEWEFESTEKFVNEAKKEAEVNNLTGNWSAEDWQNFNYGMKKYAD